MDREAFLNTIQQFLYFPREAGRSYSDIVNVTIALEKYYSTGDMTDLGGGEEEDVKAEEPGSQDILTLVTAVSIAGRYPWKTYEEWKAAAERLQSTAKNNAAGFAQTNGLVGLGFESLLPPPSQNFPGFNQTPTSAPVLFINSAGDPVTPMSAAEVMSGNFEDSSWFIQNSPGHGYENAPSKCTANILATYFADATVPKPGTWCETDVTADYYFGGELSKDASKGAAFH